MPKDRVYKKGEHIGPYEIISLISAGGRAHLYEARPLPAGRGALLALGIERVMLKVARLNTLSRDPAAQRLLRERLDREFQTLRALALLKHPNIVFVYDFGWAGAVPYYAMEVVDGLTLSEALEHRPHLGQILRVYAELCGGVLFLHNAGICHRDIKPDNVMLRRDGGSPVLIDFGSCLPPTGYRLTGPRDLLGTLDYVSPGYAEHLLGLRRTRPYLATPADDVWSLGIVLYEILTGAVPWRTPLDHHVDELLREIKRGQVAHPCEVNEQVPQALGDLVMRMLEPSRRARLQHAGEVLELLGRAAERSNTLGRVPAPRDRHEEVEPDPNTGPSGNVRGHMSAGFLAVAGLALAIFTVGALFGGAVVMRNLRAPQPSSQQAESAPRSMFSEVDLTGGRSAEMCQMGEKAPPEFWVSKELFPRQKHAPCDAGLGEVDFYGGCWTFIADVKPPCGRLYRNGDKCYRWISVEPQAPISSQAQ